MKLAMRNQFDIYMKNHLKYSFFLISIQLYYCVQITYSCPITTMFGKEICSVSSLILRSTYLPTFMLLMKSNQYYTSYVSISVLGKGKSVYCFSK